MYIYIWHIYICICIIHVHRPVYSQTVVSGSFKPLLYRCLNIRASRLISLRIEARSRIDHTEWEGEVAEGYRNVFFITQSSIVRTVPKLTLAAT